MDANEIVVPILKAINDLRDEVRENRQEIKEMKVEIQSIRTENEARWNKHEEETRRQRAEDKAELERIRAEDKAEIERKRTEDKKEWMKIREQDKKEAEELAKKNVKQITDILYLLSLVIFNDSGHPPLIIAFIKASKLKLETPSISCPSIISFNDTQPLDSPDSYNDMGLINNFDILPVPLCITLSWAGLAEPVKIYWPFKPVWSKSILIEYHTTVYICQS